MYNISTNNRILDLDVLFESEAIDARVQQTYTCNLNSLSWIEREEKSTEYAYVIHFDEDK